jgi:hypothetical protein
MAAASASVSSDSLSQKDAELQSKINIAINADAVRRFNKARWVFHTNLYYPLNGYRC